MEQPVGKLGSKKRRRDEPARSSGQQMRLGPAPSKDEKYVRGLNKKLRDIEALQQREADGEVLDAQQQAKVATLDDVLEKMEEALQGQT